MPELPEVETVARGLRDRLIGSTIKEVKSLHPRAVKGDSLPIEILTNCKVFAINRRGKFIWFDIGKDFVLTTHLGMSGQYLFLDKPTLAPRFCRALFYFKPTEYLAFNDQRTFGWISVEKLSEEGGKLIPSSILKIAPDIFDPFFSKSVVWDTIRKRNSKIKHLLLDQSILSGIGNIYADESLWYARINPDRLGSDLSDDEFSYLLSKIRFVLDRAVHLGGTSFDEQYVDSLGKPGLASKNIKVYQREGKGCYRCGDTIKKIPFGQRYTRFCPTCQI